MAGSSVSKSKIRGNALRRSSKQLSISFDKQAVSPASLLPHKKQSSILNQLRRRQRQAFEFAISTPQAAVWAGQGSGKSWIAAAVLEHHLATETDYRALLLVKAANLETTWLRLLQRLQVPILLNPKHARDAKPPFILLLPHTQVWPRRELLRHVAWSFICFDESQKIKARGSRISRATATLHAPLKLLLSGTPFDDVKHDPQELWAQFRFLAPEIFGTRWQDFFQEYCKPTGYMGHMTVFRSGKMERALEKIRPHVLRIETHEVFDLPPPVLHQELVPLPRRAQDLYQALDRDMIGKVSETTVTAPLLITLISKLDQICGGFVIDDERRAVPVGTRKIAKVREILTRVIDAKPSAGPVVIFCTYLWEIDRLERALAGRRVATMTGRNRKTRTQVQDQFQAGELDVLVVQQRTGGESIDLFRAHHAIFYSFNHSSIDWDQSIARLQRGGQTQQVHVWVLLVRGTNDEVKLRAVMGKTSSTRAILARYRQRQKETNGGTANSKATRRPREADNGGFAFPQNAVRGGDRSGRASRSGTP